jgi:hypothetical protein
MINKLSEDEAERIKGCLTSNNSISLNVVND